MCGNVKLLKALWGRVRRTESIWAAYITTPGLANRGLVGIEGHFSNVFP